MFEDTWVYKVLVILVLCVLLVWIYFTNEDIILDAVRGKFSLDITMVAQIGIFLIVGVVLFLTMAVRTRC
jgi:hypothetical protein